MRRRGRWGCSVGSSQAQSTDAVAGNINKLKIQLKSNCFLGNRRKTLSSLAFTLCCSGVLPRSCFSAKTTDQMCMYRLQRGCCGAGMWETAVEGTRSVHRREFLRGPLLPGPPFVLVISQAQPEPLSLG